MALGGEHGITLALLRALARRRGPLALVHFDAHVDTWQDSFGQPYGHGSVFYHAIEERSSTPPHDPDRHPLAGPTRVFDWTLAQGVTIVSARRGA